MYTFLCLGRSLILTNRTCINNNNNSIENGQGDKWKSVDKRDGTMSIETNLQQRKFSSGTCIICMDLWEIRPCLRFPSWFYFYYYYFFFTFLEGFRIFCFCFGAGVFFFYFIEGGGSMEGNAVPDSNKRYVTNKKWSTSCFKSFHILSLL